MRSESVQKYIESLLGDRTGQFVTSVMSAVNANPMLKSCTPTSVLSAAITAASMDLPINANLGFAYIVPYNNKVKDEEGKDRWEMQAQFQMGYKGFIQLAQRSGQFKRINAAEVKEGELASSDRLSGELTFEWIEDEEKRNKAKTIGYVGYFRMLNGFEKEYYMTIDEMKKHAKKYSQSYKKGYGLWVDEFDVMAKKTVLKLLVSKYGALSTSLQKAVLADQAAVEEDGYKYLDNTPEPPKEDNVLPNGETKPNKVKEKVEAYKAKKEQEKSENNNEVEEGEK